MTWRRMSHSAEKVRLWKMEVDKPESLMQDMVTLEMAGEQVCAMEHKALTMSWMMMANNQSTKFPGWSQWRPRYGGQWCYGFVPLWHVLCLFEWGGMTVSWIVPGQRWKQGMRGGKKFPHLLERYCCRYRLIFVGPAQAELSDRQS